VLLNPETRRQFDSIDPAIEDHVPSAKDVSADDFSTFSMVAQGLTISLTWSLIPRFTPNS